MKKFILFSLLMAVLPVSLMAYDVEVEGIFYNLQNENAIVTYKSKEYNSYSGDVVIPASFSYDGKTYTVTTIDTYAFLRCSELKSVELPNTITDIRESAFEKCGSLESFKIQNPSVSIGRWAFKDCSGLSSFIVPESISFDAEGNYIFEGCENLISCKSSSTQTTIQLEFVKFNLVFVDSEGNEITPNLYFNPYGRGLTDLGKLECGRQYKAEKLKPNKAFYFQANNVTFLRLGTKDIERSIEVTQIYADAALYETSYDVGDGEVLSATLYLENDGKRTVIGEKLPAKASGVAFIPVTDKSIHNMLDLRIFEYSAHGYIDGTYECKTVEYFYSPAVMLENSKGIALSSTCARLQSEVNLSNYCTTAGIEWRRYDAPSNIPSTKVSCPVANGYLLGTLRNLKDDVYYEFRPYVESANGNVYYGEWAGFYTGDASVYFEPEIETYSPIINGNEVTFRGYVLEGSDAILSQGFQYKLIGSGTKAADSEWTEINANGILMDATVEDLNGEFIVRSFARTAQETYYGQEMSFTIIGGSGIENFYSETEEPQVVGYYNLNGNKFNEPQKGFNIVLFSNGVAKKIMVK